MDLVIIYEENRRGQLVCMIFSWGLSVMDDIHGSCDVNTKNTRTQPL